MFYLLIAYQLFEGVLSHNRIFRVHVHIRILRVHVCAYTHIGVYTHVHIGESLVLYRYRESCLFSFLLGIELVTYIS